MAILDRILGRHLASSEEDEQKIGILAGIPILGLDGLSSAGYGPEAALAVLLSLGALGPKYIVPITIVVLPLLTILYFSYRQTIAAYPTGGGSYTVAKENLGVHAGLLAAAALMLDYILTVAVGISAGIGALVSAAPRLQPYTLTLCLITLGLITLVNMRGTKESGLVFGLPTYLYIGTLFAVIAVGTTKLILGGGHAIAVVVPPPLTPAIGAASFWLLLRAFASGCTAMTGVEAVSNGVSAFAAPSVRNAQRTLTAIVVILTVLLLGIAVIARGYGIGAMDQEQSGYQSVISQVVAAVVGRGLAYYITIGSVLVVLTLSANTSFAGFPRLCRLIAEDSYLPRAFAVQGRRLVYNVGILFLAALAGLLLVAFGGITDRLIPLYAVGAFGAFTLSQAGMVRHWMRLRGRGSRSSMTINAVGAVATALALAIILAAKFVEGAWITVVLIPIMLFVFMRVKHHYHVVAQRIRCPRPINLTGIEPPVVIVPIRNWDLLSERALRFALRLSTDVIAVNISIGAEDNEFLRKQWPDQIEGPIRKANLPVPRLVIVPSPYRRLLRPLIEYLEVVKSEYPDRIIAVVIPELVEKHWYQYLLHNQRAAWLKADLLFHGDRRVVVINIPWYLKEEGD